MTDQIKTENRIILGDRVPWFSAPLVTGGSCPRAGWRR